MALETWCLGQNIDLNIWTSAEADHALRAKEVKGYGLILSAWVENDMVMIQVDRKDSPTDPLSRG